MSEADLIVTRTRRKFEELKETCMERYVSREQRIVVTLNFCMTALERLEGWALFAIFPTDELDGEKYLYFVQKRFQCVASQLRGFDVALRRNQKVRILILYDRGKKSHDSRMEISVQDTYNANRHGGEMLTRSNSSSGDGSLSSRRNVNDDDVVPSTSNASTDIAANHAPQTGTLRESIARLSKQYIEEGNTIKNLVLGKLQTWRRNLHTIYQWGLSSLDDLHDVLDESMADELLFMIRGKMTRLLSDIGVFEEAAVEIERNMSQSSSSSSAKFSVPADHKMSEQETEWTSEGQLKSNDVHDLVKSSSSVNGASLTSSSGSSATLYLSKNATLAGLQHRFEEDEILTFRSDGSPPEPPISPRPKALINHPKILKDKLQTYIVMKSMDHTW